MRRAQVVKHIRTEVSRGRLLGALARNFTDQPIPADGSGFRVQPRLAEGVRVEQASVGAARRTRFGTQKSFQVHGSHLARVEAQRQPVRLGAKQHQNAS